MEKSEPPSSHGALAPGGSQIPPADFRCRAVARLLDFCLVLAPLIVVPRGHERAGELLSLALLLCGDSLFGAGRSLGKRIAGLRTLVLKTRRPAGLSASVRRNSVFAVALLPALLGAQSPALTTALLLGILGALEAKVALRKLTRDFGQRRLGDLLAGTQVIDASIAIGLPAAQARASRAPAPLVSSRAARLQAGSTPSSTPNSTATSTATANPTSAPTSTATAIKNPTSTSNSNATFAFRLSTFDLRPSTLDEEACASP